MAKNSILIISALNIAASVFMMISCSSAGKSGVKHVSEYGAVIPYSVMLTTENSVKIMNGGYGSDACVHPDDSSMFYLITDRGPNIDYKGAKGKGKLFPIPEYTPRIGLFQIQNDGSVKQLKTILLKDPKGNPITGLPNPAGKGATGEIAYAMNGSVLPADEYGLDSEGLAAMKDGTFWVSDEYGPHIVHYSADGVQLERLSPYGIETEGRDIPAVFARRRANRGMEGLTVTPDQKTLFGIMQSAMFNPSKDELKNKTVVRILSFDIATGKTEQYLYQQENGTDSCSGLLALSDSILIVIERDGKFSGEKEAHKKLYRIDLSHATDVSGDDVTAPGGMTVNGKTIEQCTPAELSDAGIRFVKKEFITDLTESLPDKYPHDKLEGVWLIDENTVGVVNDNDFALTVENNAPVQKYLPGTDIIDDDVMYIVNIGK